MISDEFKTFGDSRFRRRQNTTKIFVQKIIHFIEIQNIHSKQIFIFLKSRIFIQKNIHFLKIQNIHSNKIFIFSKRAVWPRAILTQTHKQYQQQQVHAKQLNWLMRMVTQY